MFYSVDMQNLSMMTCKKKNLYDTLILLVTTNTSLAILLNVSATLDTTVKM